MSDFTKDRKGTGTREWSEHSMNVGRGCSHLCRYCYATTQALRFKLIEKREEWADERLTKMANRKSARPKDGVIMLPTTTDITPFYLPTVIEQALLELKVGNKLLLVSKPHLECVQEMCNAFADYKSQILFRFTIGTLDEWLTDLWEPGAPKPSERLNALQHAFESGYATSVSMEPFLGSVDDAIATYEAVKPFVNETIWVGKMNKPDLRVDQSEPEVKNAVELIAWSQRDVEIRRLFEALDGDDKIAWKDSIKEVMGLS